MMKTVSEHGFVLAGGRSRRMGRDKAGLELDGVTLLERAVRLLRSLEIPVTAVLNDEQGFGVDDIAIIRDLIPEAGPLGGLHAALLHTSAEANFVLGCDLPLLTAELFHCLRRHLRGASICLPVDSRGVPQPLSAIYSRECLPTIERHLKSADLSLRGLVSDPALKVRRVTPAEHRIPDSRFLNVNTPQDLARLSSTIEGLRP